MDPCNGFLGPGGAAAQQAGTRLGIELMSPAQAAAGPAAAPAGLAEVSAGDGVLPGARAAFGAPWGMAQGAARRLGRGSRRPLGGGLEWALPGPGLRPGAGPAHRMRRPQSCHAPAVARAKTAPDFQIPPTSSMRHCSQCSMAGHNARTCVHAEAARDPADQTHEEQPSSDSGEPGLQRRERKKGVAWTEEEHLAFLAGLRELGKGQWCEIAKHFVRSRTSTQVASHAQKHFTRQADGKRKRRSSLFDLQIPVSADGAVPAKRHSSGEPAAPAAPYAGAAAEQLALQQLLMANPAALLQAKAAGLGGMLPGGYAGFMGFPGYMGVDTLLSGQAFMPQLPYGLPFGLPSQQAAALLFAQQQQQQAALMMAAAAMPCAAASVPFCAPFFPPPAADAAASAKPPARHDQGQEISAAASPAPAGSGSTPPSPCSACKARSDSDKAAEAGSPCGSKADDGSGSGSGSDDLFGHRRLYRPEARVGSPARVPQTLAGPGMGGPGLLQPLSRSQSFDAATPSGATSGTVTHCC